MSTESQVREIVARLGLSEPAGLVVGRDWRPTSGAALTVRSPIDGGRIGRVTCATPGDVDVAVAAAAEAFRAWRTVPAPQRGQFVRRVGQALREHQSDLAALVTLEVGKIPSEAVGEVQEMIDMADFAVGQSRQLYALSFLTSYGVHGERTSV